MLASFVLLLLLSELFLVASAKIVRNEKENREYYVQEYVVQCKWFRIFPAGIYMCGGLGQNYTQAIDRAHKDQ